MAAKEGVARKMQEEAYTKRCAVLSFVAAVLAALMAAAAMIW